MPRAIGEVRCQVHGPMKFIFAKDEWQCVGFDGEGCPAIVTSEDICRALGEHESAGSVNIGKTITITPTGRIKVEE